ncbi:unnamed protein product [Effrenium voratum]|nr:unnamed protein product [Effrenium voratum]|mmetsp:Transcript_93897/g.223386  ORF Transcript_93897/g.223386 Transcript_93897/m.223386 type:complete len:497 (+) Transcript_93897:65-1555(+)
MSLQPSSGSTGSPNSAENSANCEDSLSQEEISEEHRCACPGDMAKIPTTDTLACVAGDREPAAKDTKVSDGDKREGRAPMHKIVVPRRSRLRSPSPENLSPILGRRSHISSRLFSPVSLSAPRVSLGARNRQPQAAACDAPCPRTGSPSRQFSGTCTRNLRYYSDPKGSRTPPPPESGYMRETRVSVATTGKGLNGKMPRPARHSIGSCTGTKSPYATPPMPGATPPVPCTTPTVPRSASQSRLGESRRQSKGEQSPAFREPKDEAGRTQLMHAARAGDLNKTLALLQCGSFVDAIDSCKCTALMYAATYGHAAVAQCLADHAANVNAQSHDKWTPLIAAAYNGHMAVTELLLSRGASIDSADERGWTALMHVAFNGKLDIMKCLLDHGARADQEDKEARTALVYAAFSGHLEGVKLLLANATQSSKNTSWRMDGTQDGTAGLALMFAADKGHSDIVRAFLEASVASAQTLRSALELANFHGHHEVAKLILLSRKI